MKTVADYIRTIPDFPEKGIMFRDITTVIQDADGAVIQTDIQEVLPSDRFAGAQMLANVMEARKRLAGNVSWQSVLEMLFFDMAGGKGLWQ